jgi:esterase
MNDPQIIEASEPPWPPPFQQAGTLRREWEHLQRLALVAGLDRERVIMPSRGYVDVGDLNLHYVEWLSPQTTRNVLFLHGGALQARTWDAVCLFLRDSLHCTALDLRGHGESDWSPSHDYSLAHHAEDIAGFITARQLEPVVLVGHSLGGLASLLVASAHPALIAALVLVDIAPTTNAQATGRVRSFIQSRQGFNSADELLEHVLSFAPRRRKDLLAGSLVHNVQELPDGTLAWKYDPSHFTIESIRPADEELWACVSAITCPILLVRGERSRVVAAETAERLVAQAQDARVYTVEQAGHTVQGDDPRGLADLVRDFVTDKVGPCG